MLSALSPVICVTAGSFGTSSKVTKSERIKPVISLLLYVKEIWNHFLPSAPSASPVTVTTIPRFAVATTSCEVDAPFLIRTLLVITVPFFASTAVAVVSSGAVVLPLSEVVSEVVFIFELSSTLTKSALIYPFWLASTYT